MSETRATADTATAPDAPESAPPHHRMTQAVVLTTAVACVAVFWFAGALLHVPAYRHYEGSLLQQPGAAKLTAVAAALVLFVGCAAAAQLVAGRWWLYAGLFSAAAGLAALSARAGPSRYVYFHADSAGDGRGVFLTLLVEMVLLFAAVGAVWFLVTRQAELLETAPTEPAPARLPGRSSDWTGKARAVATQAAIMAFALLIFSRTDTKKCALISVLLAAFIGTSLAEHLFREEKAGAWYWAGPLLVGAIGFLLNFFTADPLSLQTGSPAGPLAALARPLPLDYASLGTIGAILGYWIGSDHPTVATGVLLLNPHLLYRAGPSQ